MSNLTLYNDRGEEIKPTPKYDMNGVIIFPAFYHVQQIQREGLKPISLVDMNLLKVLDVERVRTYKQLWFMGQDDNELYIENKKIDTLLVTGTICGFLGESINGLFKRAFEVRLGGTPIKDGSIEDALKKYDKVSNVVLGKLYHRLSLVKEQEDTVRFIPFG